MKGMTKRPSLFASFPHHIVLLQADAAERLKEICGDRHLELLGIELDPVAGLGVVEEEGEGNGALVLFQDGHEFFLEFRAKHAGLKVDAESGEEATYPPPSCSLPSRSGRWRRRRS